LLNLWKNVIHHLEMKTINKTLKHNPSMLERLLKDLFETWGYTQEELDDIREKMEELAYSSYLIGYDQCDIDHIKSFTSYGKSEDYE